MSNTKIKTEKSEARKNLKSDNRKRRVVSNEEFLAGLKKKAGLIWAKG